MQEQELKLNLANIALPSQTLSRSGVEALDPASHPSGRWANTQLSNEMLVSAIFGAMCLKEGWLAEKAFNAVLSKPDPYPQASREELIAALSEDYQFFEIERGSKSAEAKLHRLEAAAAAQARKHLGTGRG